MSIITEISLLTIFFLGVYVVCLLFLFASPDGLLPVCFGVPFALPSSPPCPSPIEFRCGDHVGEFERGRLFPLPFLFASCLNAHESPNEHWPLVIHRVQSSLSELCLAFSLPFPLAFPLLGAPTAGLSSSRFLALTSYFLSPNVAS